VFGADIRLTVDTPQDLALIGAVFDALVPDHPSSGLADILDLLDARPELRDLNRAIEQKPVR
jgi:spore coat polysaccharide biosynthesis protein SpsF